MSTMNKDQNKIKCPYCGIFISKSNIDRHKKWHEDNPNKKSNAEKALFRQSLDHSDLKCKYCGKECKNKNSLIQHEIRCLYNENRLEQKAWNKGLTKDIDPRVLKASDNLKKAYKENKRIKSRKGKPGTFLGKKHSDETKEKLRQVAYNNQLGGWNHKNQIDYNGIKLGSSYELIVAKELDKNNIKWERPSFVWYVDNKGIKHRYYPDFYLPDYNVYLDPKNSYLIKNINKNFGYSDIDKITWVCNQNNITILIIDKDNLSWDKILSKISNIQK